MRTVGVLLLSILVILLLLSSCKKTPVYTPDFETITTTGADCQIIGQPDSTDWSEDSILSTKELALFNFNDNNIVITDSSAGRVYVYPACPNPGNGAFRLQIVAARECKFKMVCVNTDLQILAYQINRIPGGYIEYNFDYSNLTAFTKASSYRIYYGFYNARDSLYYKGHGDIRIQ